MLLVNWKSMFPLHWNAEQKKLRNSTRAFYKENQSNNVGQQKIPSFPYFTSHKISSVYSVKNLWVVYFFPHFYNHCVIIDFYIFPQKK